MIKPQKRAKLPGIRWNRLNSTLASEDSADQNFALLLVQLLLQKCEVDFVDRLGRFGNLANPIGYFRN